MVVEVQKETVVLVLTRDQRVLQEMSSILASEGNLRVVATPRVEEALDVLEDERVGVLVTEARLEGMGVVDLVRFARRVNECLPIIVITEPGTHLAGNRMPGEPMIRLMERAVGLDAVVEAVRSMVVKKSEEEDCKSPYSFDLYDLTELLAVSRESWSVEVTGKDRYGTLIIEDGELLFAATDDLEGEEAFREMLQWEAPTIREIAISATDVQRNVFAPLPVLLEEAQTLAGMHMKASRAARGFDGTAANAIPVTESALGYVMRAADSESWGGELAGRLERILGPWEDLLRSLKVVARDSGIGKMARVRLLGSGGGVGCTRIDEEGKECHVLVEDSKGAGRLTLVLGVLASWRSSLDR